MMLEAAFLALCFLYTKENPNVRPICILISESSVSKEFSETKATQRNVYILGRSNADRRKFNLDMTFSVFKCIYVAFTSSHRAGGGGGWLVRVTAVFQSSYPTQRNVSYYQFRRQHFLHFHLYMRRLSRLNTDGSKGLFGSIGLEVISVKAELWKTVQNSKSPKCCSLKRYIYIYIMPPFRVLRKKIITLHIYRYVIYIVNLIRVQWQTIIVLYIYSYVLYVVPV